MLQHCVPREVVLSVDFDFVCLVVLLIFISVNFYFSIVSGYDYCVPREVVYVL